MPFRSECAQLQGARRVCGCFCFARIALVSALDDGLARTPPMGWRNWNAFMQDISQDILERTMDAMVKKGPNGLSLLDVGYSDVGLDDYWQACGQGLRGGFHDKAGRPIVNTTTFPDLRGMVSHGHDLNLTVGWYMNNCYCAESGFSDLEIDLHQRKDVEATVGYGFDSLKLDGCGQENNLTRWVELLHAESPTKPVLIENCHWGGDLASPDWCPYHFARTSPDVTTGKGTAEWAPIWLNMQTMARTNSAARPGCWGYPDMLQTGNCMAEYQRPSMDRTIFGMWAIVSSPLILSFDLHDEARRSRVWEVITNRDAIAVNQAWVGDAGRLVYSWDPSDAGQPLYLWSEFCDAFSDEQNGWRFDDDTKELKFNLGSDDADDLCLDIQPNVDPSFVTLTLCIEPRKSKLAYSDSGQIMDGSNAKCLTPFSYMWSTGPGFVLKACEPYTNHAAWGTQHFSVGVKPRRNMVTHQNGYCLAARSSAPMNSNVMQLWAKKIRGAGEKKDAFDVLTGPAHIPHIERLLAKFNDGDDRSPLQAALVVNADEQDGHTFTFNDEVLRKLFGADVGRSAFSVSAYDVWKGQTLATRQTPLQVQVRPRGSAFYLLKLHDSAEVLIINT